MKVVFDTVVFVRGLLNPFGRWGALLFDHADAYELVVSPPILAEYLDVLHRPALIRKYRRVATRDARAILDRLTQATVVEPSEIPSVSRDPKDDVFFATAALGGARYLMSEDNDQLVVGAYEDVRVVTAAAFLQILAHERREGGEHQPGA